MTQEDKEELFRAYYEAVARYWGCDNCKSPFVKDLLFDVLDKYNLLEEQSNWLYRTKMVETP